MSDKFRHFLLSLGLTLAGAPAGAQVIPDRSLPAPSIVIPLDKGSLVIVGGTTKGANLFHSFERFSIPPGTIATFNNDIAIANIFSRVTGTGISRIDGILAANGRANLFLLNPNGIVFGPGSRVAIGGNFVATTAREILFADGSRYGSRGLDAGEPILTVSLPVGLEARDAGPIVVEGNGHDIYSSGRIIGGGPIGGGLSPNGLRLVSGQNLTLAGGEIALEGGVITVPSGRIDLIATRNGTISWDSPDGSPVLNNVAALDPGPISMTRQSLLDVSGFGGGDVSLIGGRVFMTDASLILNANYGSRDSGTISVRAKDFTSIGITPFNVTNRPGHTLGRGLLSPGFSTGASASIRVEAGTITLSDTTAMITSGVDGSPGRIEIEAAERLSILGKAPTEFLPAGSVVSTNAVREPGGDITIKTPELIVRDAGSIQAVTFGPARGGDIKITSERVELDGYFSTPRGFIPTVVGATTLGTGRSGDTTLVTDILNVRDGARVNAVSIGAGDGGNLSVFANREVLVEGKPFPDLDPAKIVGSVDRLSPIYEDLGVIFPLTGNAGEVSIVTPRLILRSGGEIGVNNDGTGNGGRIDIRAERLELDGKSEITARTESGQGENIRIVSTATTLGNSSITTAAGREGDGGNLSIDSRFTAVLDGSEISANAFKGRGGNVTISSRGLFLDRGSRITASSELGLPGRVTLNVQNFQSAPAGVKFPDRNDFESVAVSSCIGGNDSRYRFTITGSGGTRGLPGEAPASFTVDRAERENATGLLVEGGRAFLVRCGG